MILDHIHDKALKENDQLRGQIILLARSEHKKIHQGALMNAARIAVSMKWDGSQAAIDTITEAATALAEAEDAPGFSWQDQSLAWEEVCDYLACAVTIGADEPYPEIIRKLLAR